MSNTAEDTTSKKSVRINHQDQDNIERAGYPLDKSVSTLFSDLAEDARKLQELKDQKKEEVRKKREEIRDIEQEWDIE